VSAGTTHAFVGREGSGKTAIVRCALGDIRPESGRVAVLGVDPRRERRALRRCVRFDEAAGELRLDTDPPTALLFTSDPGLAAAAAADRVGFLKEGRLVVEDALPLLLFRFRRIRYVNEVTETRIEYGTELDLFDAVRVKARGWGVDAAVSNYDDALFERFRATEGVRDARSEAMTLEEIFAAVVGEVTAI
jgi:ABC-type multidrug transport system ATPase subunit